MLPTALTDKLKHEQTLKTALDNVPKNMREAIGKHAVDSQIVTKQKCFYSTVRFSTGIDLSVPGQVTYTIRRGVKRWAFAYSANGGDGGSTAGFPSDYQLTEAETNLVSGTDTGGSTVLISGLSFYLGETSDAGLAKRIWANTFVDITLNGADRYVLLGKMGRIPASGGLFGVGQSHIEAPPLNADQALVHSLSNGMPMHDNFHKLAEPIYWLPVNNNDSKFRVRFEVARDIVVTAHNRAEAPGVAKYDPPTKEGEDGTYVDVTVYLKTLELTPRSKQA